jgi:single-strand DNA-binding protein
MADGLNKVMLLGNLGSDPELKMTSSGQAVLKMRLATAESYLDRNKTRQERTEWHSIVLWGKRAEALSKFLSKGAKLFVEGRLQTSSWDDKDGVKRYKTEINATNIILAGSGKGGGRKGGSDDAPSDDYDDEDDRGGGSGSGGTQKPDDDDDIPFCRCVIGEATEAWWRL